MKPGDETSFDAYYKWLAIPPHEQPPNHYRLLGVELYEQDLDVIAAAADRQMAHIKSYAAGKFARQSQRLLNELAAARICLLNPEQTKGYDEKLRRTAADIQRSEPLDAPPVVRIGELAPTRHRSKKRNRRTSLTALLFVIAGVIGILAGYGALSLILEQQAVVSPATESRQVARSEPRSKLPDQDSAPQLATADRPERFGSDEVADSPRGIELRQRPRQPDIPNLQERIDRRKAELDDLAADKPIEIEVNEARREPQLPPPSIIVPLTLDDPTIIVVAMPDGVEAEQLMCDVGLSENLLRNSARFTSHEIVAEKLSNRGKHTAEFAAGVDGCQVGLDIAVFHRSSGAVCDIRPRFSLPSGEVKPFTMRDLEAHRKLLTSLMSKVAGAKSVIGRLQATRDRQSQQASNARSAAVAASGGNTAAATNVRAAARTQVMMAEAAVERADKRIADAQSWLSKENAILADQRALDGVRDYANRIAADGSIYIRFYADEVTIPATVK